MHSFHRYGKPRRLAGSVLVYRTAMVTNLLLRVVGSLAAPVFSVMVFDEACLRFVQASVLYRSLRAIQTSSLVYSLMFCEPMHWHLQGRCIVLIETLSVQALSNAVTGAQQFALCLGHQSNRE